MKSVRKLAVLSSAFAAALPGIALADFIAVEYGMTKFASCKVTYQYYDGDKNRVTCSVTDSARRDYDNLYQLTCSGDDSIRHVNHKDSAIIVSADGQCNYDYIKRIKAKKTKGKNKSETAANFDGSGNTEKDQVAYYLDNRVNSRGLCYQRMDLEQMERDGIALKVKLNKKKTYGHDLDFKKVSCNRTYGY